MKKLSYYLDKAKGVTNSDYMTAKRIGVTRAAISKARKEETLGENSCIELAKLLDINPIEIIAASNSVKHPENKNFWGKWVATVLIATSVMIPTGKPVADHRASLNPIFVIMRRFGII